MRQYLCDLQTMQQPLCDLQTFLMKFVFIHCFKTLRVGKLNTLKLGKLN